MTSVVTPPVRHYYITDKAFQKLILMAQQGHYVKPGTERAKGMSDFFNDLAHYALKDTRPPFVVQRHQEERRNNRAPTWTFTRFRRARSLKLTDEAIESYLTSALVFGIIEINPFPIGGPRRDTPYPAISIVLEAIGLGYLTPESMPIQVPNHE